MARLEIALARPQVKWAAPRVGSEIVFPHPLLQETGCDGPVQARRLTVQRRAPPDSEQPRLPPATTNSVC